MSVRAKPRLPDFGVLLPPEARASLQKGFDQMANLIRVTLGPVSRVVAIAPITNTNQAPEMPADGATIARRIVEFPNRYENMGAMILRHLCWRIREGVGDGSATAAVIAQAVLSEANRYIAAGGNAMSLKRGVERALEVALAEIEKMARPIDDPQEMTSLVTGATGDPELGEMIGEIYDIIGRDGIMLVQESQGTVTDREYIEGVHWDKGWISPHMATDTSRMVSVLEETAVLVSDINVNHAEDVLPVLQMVHEAGYKSLFMIINDMKDEALSVLMVNKEKGVLTTVAVKAPSFGERRVGILGDIAVMTGGRVLIEESGVGLASAKLSDIGRARRIWVDSGNFNLVGGYGDPDAIRDRIAAVKASIPGIKDEQDREKARERLGKLVGGVAVLNVGAPSETARKSRVAVAEHARETLRAAAAGGVVPGGGAALMSCIPALKKIEAKGDEAMGVKILITALEAPMRWITYNAGFEPRPILAEVREKPAGWGFDVMAGELRDMEEAGILDPYPVIRMALEKSVSGALMALTTDALVSTKKPSDRGSLEP